MTAALPRIARALGVEPGEGRLFAWAAATVFLVHAASVSLANAADTFFLKRIGVNLLPVAFLVSSLLLVVTTAVVVRLAARRPQIPLLMRTFFGLALALVPLWLLAVADVRSVFAALVLISKQVESIAVLVFWVAIGGLLDARQAKRLYAPIVAGGTLGEVVGSFGSGTIGHTLGIAALLPVAAGALVVAGLLARRVAALAPARLARPAPRRAAGRAASALGLFGPLWRQSRLFRVLAVSAVLCGSLGPMLYFQFAYAADLATSGADAELRLLGLYAAFRGWLNVVVLALQLVGTSRLFAQLGIPLAATLSPLIYLAGFFSVSLRLGLEAAIGAMAGATVQDHAVYDPAQRILVTLFPERQRPAATTLIEGPLQRTGGVLGNLLVLAVIAVGTPAAVALVGIPIAAMWAAAALLLWRIYPTLLLEVAAARRLRVEEGLSLPELVDPATQRVLAASLVDPDPDRVRTACELVAAGPTGGAVTALARAAALASAANRPLVLETLQRVLERRNGSAPASVPDAARQLETLLENRNQTTIAERTALVQMYGRLTGDVRPDSHAAAVLARLRADPVESVRLAATARLQRAGLSEPGDGDLDRLLREALSSHDPSSRRVGLDELRTALIPGDTNGAGAGETWQARMALLTARLEEPADRARVTEILADLAAAHPDRAAALSERVLAYATDPDPRVRAAVLQFVGHARIETQLPWVVERLAADDASEAEAAAGALRAFGPTAANALLDALHRGKRAARQAVLPILRDMHIDDATARTLIDRELRRLQQTRLVAYGLGSGDIPEVVFRRLRERVDEELHTILLLLATQRSEDRFAVLARLLARTPGGRGRAVLLEALEALLPPEDRVRLMPLLDENDARAAQAAAQALGRGLPSFHEALREALADSDPLTVSLLAASHDPPSLAANRILADSASHDDGHREHGVLSRVEIVLHLHGLELFARLTTRQLNEIATVVHEEVFASGAAIVREGEFGDCMYLIVTGEVQIARAGQYTLTAGPGELFGEMSLFDGETRFATVTALRRTRLLRLDRPDLFELMDEQPSIAIGICQTLSRHMRDSIKRLEERRAKS